jgi:DNA-binding MarR family transcriptional regulator
MKEQVTSPPDTRDIEVAAQLRTVIHRLVKMLRRETHSTGELSLTERSTMGSLYQHGMVPPSALAQIEKVTTQSMSQIINHLSELNYIEKMPSGDDKRKVLLSLSPTGRAYVEDKRQRKQEWLAHALHERVTPAEREQLMHAMDILAKLIDE